MSIQRPNIKELVDKDVNTVPMSCQRVMQASNPIDSIWVGPNEAEEIGKDDLEAYNLAHQILCHLAIKAPREHSSGHPGGSMSAFTFSYFINKYRDPSIDQPMRMSAGHLSILAFGLEWMFGRNGNDERLKNPDEIIKTFRTPNGLPGHIEAGIGTIPFGTGPLGKGVSNALGVALGLKINKKDGIVDVLLADGDSQEGQVYEAFRLASQLKLDNLIVHGDFNDIQLGALPSETVASDFSSMAAAAGWQVIEVQNGNNPHQVSTAIKKANDFTGNGKPIFICYYTTMGYGISFMEEASNTGGKIYHGAPLNDEEAEIALKELKPLNELVNEFEPYRNNEKQRFEKNSPTKTNILIDFDSSKLSNYKRSITEEKGAARKDFGATHLKNLLKADPRIIILHADLAGSGGFDKIDDTVTLADGSKMPRVLNVGVAEANMAMMAAGLRQAGMLPITYTFAAFGTNEARANARLIDINCQHTRCGVLHDCTHAGLSVGEDGETHQERHYLNIPFDNTEVWMTADSNQAAAMAEQGLNIIADGKQSVYTFFPRDGHEQLKSPDGSIIYDGTYVFDGKADLIRGQGNVSDHITIIATGLPVHSAVAAADALSKGKNPLSVRVLNVACVRPLDASAILQSALETGHIIVVEDHSSESGLAAQVADVIADFSLPCSLRRLGVNQYFPSAKAKELYLMAGIDEESIIDAIEDEIRSEVCGGEDAFVSAVSEIINNLRNSRFKESALPFLSKLQTEKGYIDSLRKFWKNKECPVNELPKNEELLKKIKEIF